MHTYWDLHGRPQQHSLFANFAAQEYNYVPFDKFMFIFADEFARFIEFQASQKFANPSYSTNHISIDHSGKPITCLVSSFNK